MQINNINDQSKYYIAIMISLECSVEMNSIDKGKSIKNISKVKTQVFIAKFDIFVSD